MDPKFQQPYKSFLPRCLSRAAFALAGVTFASTFFGCGGGSGTQTVSPPTNPTLASISVSGSNSVTDTGTVQFSATAKDSNGNTMSGVSFTWASSAANYATINSSGLATAVAPGSAQITASAQGVTSPPVTLSVTTGPVATITVSGAASVAQNATDQFSATAKDSLGFAISGLTYTWLSSATNYATINSTGLATGVAAGTTNITASSSGVTSAPFALIVSAAPVPTSLSFGGPTSLNWLGVPLNPEVTVSVLDQNGHLDTGASGSVTMALGANPTGATLSGVLVEPVSDGVATFPGLLPDYPGTGYTLTASLSGLPTVTSSAFNVLASHSSLLSLEAQDATASDWTYTHTSAGFTATASTTGNLVTSSLESVLDEGTAVPWSSEPQETINYSNLASAPNTVAITGNTQSATTDVSTLTWVDCANLDTASSQPMSPTSSTCATLSVPQSPATGGFSGFADPTIRMDPSTGILWLGYSWPHAWNPGSNSTDAVDLYLTSSTNGGATWATPTALWPSVATTDPTNGDAAYTSNEILNILPGVLTGQTSATWFSIHLSYYVDDHTSILDALVPKSAMVFTWAATPAGLATAPAAQTFTFTASGAGAQIPTDLNLTTLDPSLANCQQWGEPALHMINGNLYMALMCKYGTSSTAMQPAKNFYGVFEATPNLSLSPANWGWVYNGVLAGPTQAALLEGHQFLYEMDLATRADGSIVAVVSPADDVPNGSGGSTQYVYGCRALLVQGLDKSNIGLATDANGQLEVLASVTASDISPANGDSSSGACTYEPLAGNGIVFVRQYSQDLRFPTLGNSINMFNTNVMP